MSREGEAGDLSQGRLEKSGRNRPGNRDRELELRHTVTATTINLLLLAAVLAAWAFGAFLQWRNLRHQEKVLANLERLRLHVSPNVAREKAPRLDRKSVV